MQIYNKEPVLVLWDIVKNINIEKYKEVMNEDKDSIPTNYILLRSQINDYSKNYGDGNTLIRSCDCDILLVSKGSNTNTSSSHNKYKKEIEKELVDGDFTYEKVLNGYDDENDNTTTTYSLTINYIL